MKALLFYILLLSSVFTFAQSEKFHSTMSRNIALVDSSFKSQSSLISLANNFERIATAEKNQWLPYYYAAFLQVNAGFMAQDGSKIDEYADKAEQLINKADSLEKNNSEISCIKSMIASARLTADPMNRYMTFGPVSSKHLDDAIRQDSLNPRPYFLKGQNLKYTPEQFGGGCGNAIPLLEKAVLKFKTFNPQSQLHPNWGLYVTEQILADCRK